MTKNLILSREVTEIALCLMEGLACPRSLTVAILLRHGESDQLATLAADPLHYLDSEDFWAAAQATSFLKKNADMLGDSGREARTIAKWFEAERQCYKTNQRMAHFVYRTYPESDERINDFLLLVRKNVLSILGERPPSNWEDEGRFGPGATMSDNSRYTTVPDKMSSVPSLTPDAWPFLFPWMGTKWYEANAKLGNGVNSVRGNAHFTVPKTAWILRSCGKEPSLNVFYQLALGRVMKRLLRAWGINLKEGKDIHMQVACAASLSGLFATLDLSSASDTVATMLVKLLLPPKWYEVLSHLRSPYTLIEGKWCLLEKFSSMGNGFTFELETVIFAAIASAAMSSPIPGKTLFVYGDDIIVPTTDASNVIAALEYCGFSLNKTKSFVEGSFRESCGGDYYSGIGVRPYSLENDVYEPHHLISLANGLRRSAMAHNTGSRWHKVRRSWFKCLDFIPSNIRELRGPQDLGDLVIHDDESRWLTRWRSSCIRYIRVWRPATYRKVRWNGFAYDVQMAAALYGVSRRKFRPADEGDLVPRDGVLGYKVGWVPYS